jgi:hypothetical protein
MAVPALEPMPDSGDPSSNLASQWPFVFLAMIRIFFEGPRWDAIPMRYLTTEWVGKQAADRARILEKIHMGAVLRTVSPWHPPVAPYTS